jgi:anti-sigma regulatory factor (Ser/Thr protein kinase)
LQLVDDWPFVECHTLAATRRAPHWSRRLVQDVLERWGLPTLIHDSNLLVTELVTNAVVAVGGLDLKDESRAKKIRLTLSTDYRCLLTEVWDPTIRPPTLQSMLPLDAEDGRGLFLVDTFAKEWGFYLTGSGGKIVWFTLGLGQVGGKTVTL